MREGQAWGRRRRTTPYIATTSQKMMLYAGEGGGTVFSRSRFEEGNMCACRPDEILGPYARSLDTTAED